MMLTWKTATYEVKNYAFFLYIIVSFRWRYGEHCDVMIFEAVRQVLLFIRFSSKRSKILRYISHKYCEQISKHCGYVSRSRALLQKLIVSQLVMNPPPAVYATWILIARQWTFFQTVKSSSHTLSRWLVTSVLNVNTVLILIRPSVTQ
jgi:hypothetical protein